MTRARGSRSCAGRGSRTVSSNAHLGAPYVTGAGGSEGARSFLRAQVGYKFLVKMELNERASALLFRRLSLSLSLSLPPTAPPVPPPSVAPCHVASSLMKRQAHHEQKTSDDDWRYEGGTASRAARARTSARRPTHARAHTHTHNIRAQIPHATRPPPQRSAEGTRRGGGRRGATGQGAAAPHGCATASKASEARTAMHRSALTSRPPLHPQPGPPMRRPGPPSSQTPSRSPTGSALAPPRLMRAPPPPPLLLPRSPQSSSSPRGPAPPSRRE